jgi:hypothetical protein
VTTIIVVNHPAQAGLLITYLRVFFFDYATGAGIQQLGLLLKTGP